MSSERCRIRIDIRFTPYCRPLTQIVVEDHQNPAQLYSHIPIRRGAAYGSLVQFDPELEKSPCSLSLNLAVFSAPSFDDEVDCPLEP